MIVIAKTPGRTGQFPWWRTQDGVQIVGAAPTREQARKQAGADHSWMHRAERSPVTTRISPEAKL